MSASSGSTPPARAIKAPEVHKGVWLLLPSGQHVEVFAIKGEQHPEVTLRYLDSDGTVSTGCFVVSLIWLVKFSQKVI